jgi:hypothetical protein
LASSSEFCSDTSVAEGCDDGAMLILLMRESILSVKNTKKKKKKKVVEGALIMLGCLW